MGSTDPSSPRRRPLTPTGNVLGALTLGLGDRLGDALSEQADGSPTSAAALSVMADFLDRPVIGRLREVLGLTPSGTVRLVDRLEGLGLVRRTPGADGRTRRVVLTPAGRRAAAAVRQARAGVLEAALAPLTDAESAQLGRLLGKVLAGLKRGPGATRWICRLCDTAACGRRHGRCPFRPAAHGPP